MISSTKLRKLAPKKRPRVPPEIKIAFRVILIVLYNKRTEETFRCPQTFIVRFLIIEKHVPTGFYSEA